ncbi:hypothetical protein PVAND_001844 [Polypedilum vanderplanki]|uniref:Uncharacterized protein n=1 Tax=Polypedilum vanderplanki TaxID=319348 RepID=A0A9J6BQI3_POLVA|nr:hypothetical protein PVAND_001844 [Polypedilum vanderplanki]
MTITESILSEEEPIWCLENNEKHGHFWRRDSATSRVKFKHDVEILEFVRDPEEDIFTSTGHFNHMIGERRPTHPMVVISTCICAIAVTVLLPWLMIQSNEPIE